MKLLLKFLVVLAIALLFSSCGGGTVGTGDTVSGPDTRFFGTVFDIDGQGLGNVEVIVRESGDSTLTDTYGHFDLSSHISEQTPSLIIRSGVIDRTVTLAPLNSLDSEVKVEVVVNSADNSVTLTNIEITERVSPEPIVTPNSSSGGSSSSASSQSSGASKPEPQATLVRGTIKFDDGSLVQGARLTLLPQNISTLSNAAGKFRLETAIRKGPHILNLQFGNARGSVTFNLRRAVPVTVTLDLVVKRPAGCVRGETCISATSSDLEVSLSGILVERR